jgi:hypothetical protein
MVLKKSSRRRGFGLARINFLTSQLLMRQLAADFLQRRPPRFFHRYDARALFLVKIRAALRA